jgi:hypothetical protein
MARTPRSTSLVQQAQSTLSDRTKMALVAVGLLLAGTLLGFALARQGGAPFGMRDGMHGGMGDHQMGGVRPGDAPDGHRGPGGFTNAVNGVISSRDGDHFVYTADNGTSASVEVLPATGLFTLSTVDAAAITVGANVYLVGTPDTISSLTIAAADLLVGAHQHIGMPAVVKSVSGTSVTLTAETRSGSREITVSLSGTTVVRELSAGTLADLTDNAAVSVDYAPDGATVESVTINK